MTTNEAGPFFLLCLRDNRDDGPGRKRLATVENNTCHKEREREREMCLHKQVRERAALICILTCLDM